MYDQSMLNLFLSQLLLQVLPVVASLKSTVEVTVLIRQGQYSPVHDTVLQKQNRSYFKTKPMLP